MLQSEQERGLSHLIGKWMSGPVLQRAMLNAGINIFVNEYTNKYVSTCGKVWIYYLLAFRIEEHNTRYDPGLALFPCCVEGVWHESTYVSV